MKKNHLRTASVYRNSILKVLAFWVLFTIGLAPAQAQVDWDYSETVDVMVGTRVLKRPFNRLNHFDDVQFGNPINIVGTGFSGMSTERGANLDFFTETYMGWVMPAKLEINDTISARMYGYVYNMGVASFKVISAPERFYLMLVFGLSAGRVRLAGNELVRQKNPFFVPKVTLQPKLKLGPIGISLRVEYGADISRKTWKKTAFADDNKIELDPMSWTGTSVFFCVGYGND